MHIFIKYVHIFDDLVHMYVKYEQMASASVTTSR